MVDKSVCDKSKRGIRCKCRTTANIYIFCLVSDIVSAKHISDKQHSHDMLWKDGCGCFLLVYGLKEQQLCWVSKFGSLNSYDAYRLSAWIMHYISMPRMETVPSASRTSTCRSSCQPQSASISRLIYGSIKLKWTISISLSSSYSIWILECKLWLKGGRLWFQLACYS